MRKLVGWSGCLIGLALALWHSYRMLETRKCDSAPGSTGQPTLQVNPPDSHGGCKPTEAPYVFMPTLDKSLRDSACKARRVELQLSPDLSKVCMPLIFCSLRSLRALQGLLWRFASLLRKFVHQLALLMAHALAPRRKLRLQQRHLRRR